MFVGQPPWTNFTARNSQVEHFSAKANRVFTAEIVALISVDVSRGVTNVH